MTPEDRPGAGPGPHRRAIRSFVRRAGRITTGQSRALRDLGPRFVLSYAPQVLEWDAAFGRTAPTLLEIGSGMGEASAQFAAAHPHFNLLCCEVHEPGIGALLLRIEQLGLANVRILPHDAVEVLRDMVPPSSLAGVHVWFPDPWHKKRHHKRRLVQPEFVAATAQRLVPGGYLHCATDWEPYAQQMLEVLGSEPLLRNTGDGFAPRPAWRPPSRFERRGLALGHGVRDLLFERHG